MIRTSAGEPAFSTTPIGEMKISGHSSAREASTTRYRESFWPFRMCRHTLGRLVAIDPWFFGLSRWAAGRWGCHSGTTPSRTTAFQRCHGSRRSAVGGDGSSNKSLFGRGSSDV
jgi:hypothetical protein